jgi:hypothetical protein
MNVLYNVTSFLFQEILRKNVFPNLFFLLKKASTSYVLKLFLEILIEYVLEKILFCRLFSLLQTIDKLLKNTYFSQGQHC